MGMKSLILNPVNFVYEFLTYYTLSSRANQTIFFNFVNSGTSVLQLVDLVLDLWNVFKVLASSQEVRIYDNKIFHSTILVLSFGPIYVVYCTSSHDMSIL